MSFTHNDVFLLSKREGCRGLEGGGSSAPPSSNSHCGFLLSMVKNVFFGLSPASMMKEKQTLAFFALALLIVAISLVTCWDEVISHCFVNYNVYSPVGMAGQACLFNL